MPRKIGLGIVLLVLLAFTLLYFPGEQRDKEKPEVYKRANSFGQPLPWSEVALVFPRYTVGVVEDLETGKSFAVERRGGTYHADVQPVTAKDSQVFREIFGGSGTWKRRAIIVEVGMQRIAASMNGMPHGSGKIQGNNFTGHFCIHFLGSKVHKSGKVDFAHQMMIWKAAGQPITPFQKASPREVVELVVTAINQDDGELAVLGIEPAESEDLWLINQSLLQQLPEIELRRISEIKEEDPNQVKYLVQVKLLNPGQQSKLEREGILVVKRSKGSERWLIEGKGLIELLVSPLF